MTKVFKTIIQIEILSEGGPVQTTNLIDISYEMIEGAWVGTVDVKSSEELTGKQAADALHAAGSTPSFFQLNDDGSKQEG